MLLRGLYCREALCLAFSALFMSDSDGFTMPSRIRRACSLLSLLLFFSYKILASVRWRFPFNRICLLARYTAEEPRSGLFSIGLGTDSIIEALLPSQKKGPPCFSPRWGLFSSESVTDSIKRSLLQRSKRKGAFLAACRAKKYTINQPTSQPANQPTSQ